MYREACPRLCLACPSIAAGAAAAQSQCTHKCSATVHTQVLSHNAHTSKQEPKTQEGHERRKCLSVFGML